MDMSSGRQQPSDTNQNLNQNPSIELIKLIRKLRWIGMEEEADRLAKEVTVQPDEAADCTVGTPRDTD